MSDAERPMVSTPISAGGAPRPVGGRPWSAQEHRQREPKGMKCGVEGCTAPMFERCLGQAGEVIAIRCLKNGHRWVSPQPL